MIWTAILGLANTWLGSRKAKAEQEHVEELAEIKSGLRDNDRWLRRGSAIILFFPLVWGYFDPDGVKEYFTVTLAVLPSWYMELIFMILGGIWGASSAKIILPGIVKAWRAKSKS